MEEASQGDSASGGLEGQANYPLEEVLLFLLECNVPESAVYGWHDGWDFSRIEKAFVYFKKREVEKQRDRTLAVALGASSLVSKKPLEKFLNETSTATKKDQPQEDLQSELNKLMSVFDG